MRELVAVCVIAASVAACGGESVSSPTTASTSTTSVTPTSVTPTSTAETTTPATTSPATTPTTTPVTTAAPTTAPPTTAVPPTVPPPTTVPPTDEVAHVYVTSRIGFGFGWHRLGVWDGSSWDDLADEAVYADPTAPGAAIISVDFPGQVAGTYDLEPWGCIDTDVHNGIVPTFALPALPEDPLYRQQAVGVTAATWPLQPRPVDEIGLDAAVYQDTAEALLAGSGIDPTLGDVMQVFRVDLDGDGTEEVLVSFERLSPPFGDTGDMSLVYARVVAGGGVDDQVLEQYVVTPPEPGDPEFPMIGGFRVAAIADLNGDARMEVVVAASGWEYVGTTIYEFDGTGFNPIITGGCGV